MSQDEEMWGEFYNKEEEERLIMKSIMHEEEKKAEEAKQMIIDQMLQHVDIENLKKILLYDIK